jgi:hypothetical protein
MVQYQDPKPMVMINGGPAAAAVPGGPVARRPGGPGVRGLVPAAPGGPPPMTPDEVQKRVAEMQRILHSSARSRCT